MNFEGIEISTQLQGLLSAAVEADRLPHTIILEGGSENDRLALARLLARVHVCSGENVPCGVCSDCVKAGKGFHPDISEAIATEGSKDALKVDAVREIRSNAFVFPNEAARRVFILHNMNFANEQAQNALLKILEEPPEYVRFVLTCPVSSSLLGTILSRAAVYSLGQQLGDSLNAKHSAACEKAGLVAKALVSPNEFDLMRETGVFEKDAELMMLVLGQLRLIFRDAAAKKQSPSSAVLSASPEQASLLARSLTTAQLVRLIDAVGELERAQALNANKALLVTRFCSQLRKAAGK